MVVVVAADSFYGTLVQRLELGVECLGVEVVCNRLIDEFVAEDYRLVLVALGNLLPDVAEELLCLGLSMSQGNA